MANSATSTSVSPTALPAVVAKRLCDLLLAFPSSAMRGVQWEVLVRKYEERYATRVDLAALGFSSPLVAATTLLWDVVRIVDKEDVDNPVLVVEDAVALAPQPGLLGCWPSLYHSLCEIVLENGRLEGDDSGIAVTSPARGLLLSQLKPLLARHWHTNFDENGLGFLNAEGTYVKMKKMKHLVHAVLRWRDERMQWRESERLKPSAVDNALARRLELNASKQHNDLVLRFSIDRDTNESPPAVQATADAPPVRAQQASKLQVTLDTEEVGSLDSETSTLENELARLRAENAELRSKNEFFQRRASTPLICTPFIGVSTPTQSTPEQGATPLATPRLKPDVFDDPFEPPPEARTWKFQESAYMAHFMSPAISGMTTVTGSENGYDTGSSSTCGTPMSAFNAECELHTGSNGTSDVMASSFMPMWFSLVPSTASAFGDIGIIPNGIVQRFRAHFEPVQSQQATT